MEFISEFTHGEIVESTKETQESIMKAINTIFSSGDRDPVIYTLVDETNNKACLCLYKEPLEKIRWSIVYWKRNDNNEWEVKEDPMRLQKQLSRLVHGSQDFQ